MSLIVCSSETARMPRKPRLHVDGAFYHVILRGNHREAIFFRPADRDMFASLVAEMLGRFRMRVHAYCWMTNHVHLLMQVSDAPLGRAMMRIASRFARHMQRHRLTTGHFFSVGPAAPVRGIGVSRRTHGRRCYKRRAVRPPRAGRRVP